MKDDDLEISEKSWLKAKNSLQKAAYVDGAGVGRDSAFQCGFDKGYEVGFRSGESLGFLNGIIRVINETLEGEQRRQNSVKPFCSPSQGACVICPTIEKPMSKGDIANAVIDPDVTVANVIIEQENRNKQICELKEKIVKNTLTAKQKEAIFGS